MQDAKKYEDMLYLPHHQSKTRPRMSLQDRAAQFAPFAALTGHEEAIAEEGRQTDRRVILDEQKLCMLDEKFFRIREQLGSRIPVTFTLFVPDERKTGGAYETCTGWVQKIDDRGRTITLGDKRVVPIDQIVDMESGIFSDRIEEG